MAILNRFIVCAALFLLISPAQAQQDETLRLYEQKIKAGIVYNFLKFTDWPADVIAKNGGKLNICLFGGDPFDGYLFPLRGKTAQQYVISITQIGEVTQTADCNMVFIHHNEENTLPRLFEFLQEKPVLTISDINNFAYLGGMVEMVKEEERVNLYINETVARNAGINIQHRILKMAKLVSTQKG